MAELKVGMRGTDHSGIQCWVLNSEPDRYGQIVVKDEDGEYRVIDADDFIPDPEPPTTVMVEMSVKRAQWWVANYTMTMNASNELTDLAEAAAWALKEAGL